MLHLLSSKVLIQFFESKIFAVMNVC
uniref:Uncharacterized protein n=1 Tax=Rhizophora mucronata TaxID=61149 RepID=A0A2P2R3C5_RHIMU